MNENIDLTKILKNCPKGWEFYSSTVGSVVFHKLDLANSDYPIFALAAGGRREVCFTKKGWYVSDSDAECTLFPSKDQRDWSKFTAPWLKKERFNPKTLQTFDKVLSRNSKNITWSIDYFSHMEDIYKPYQFFCLSDNYTYCIPYNDDTKHLVGTKKEAPEFYRYWED